MSILHGAKRRCLPLQLPGPGGQGGRAPRAPCWTFGQRRLQLPEHLERHCCSFLDVLDLASLYFVCHAMEPIVVQVLESLKTLKPVLLSPFSCSKMEDSVLEAASFAAALTAAHCQSLVRLINPFDDISSSPNTTSRQRPFGLAVGDYNQWMLQMIQANENTLERVDFNAATSIQHAEALMRCDNLTNFGATWLPEGGKITKDLADRFTPSNLPHLQFLSLQCDTFRLGAISQSDFKTILTRDFSNLEQLDVRAYPTVFRLLGSRFARLRKLYLSVDGPVGPEQVDDLANVVLNRPELIEFGLRYIGSHRLLKPFLLHWSMPQLVSLQLAESSMDDRQYPIFAFQSLKAPRLKKIKIKAHLDMAMVEWCMAQPHLEELCLCGERSSNPFLREEIDHMLERKLYEGAWPKLTHLTAPIVLRVPSCSLFTVKRPLKHLAILAGNTPMGNELRELLMRLPALTELHYRSETVSPQPSFDLPPRYFELAQLAHDKSVKQEFKTLSLSPPPSSSDFSLPPSTISSSVSSITVMTIGVGDDNMLKGLCFPRLHTLTMQSYFVDVTMDTLARAMPSLTCLTITASPLMRQFKGTASFNSVKELIVQEFPHGWESLDVMLRPFPKVETVSLGFLPDHYNKHLIALAANKGLSRLIHLSIVINEEAETPYVPTASDLQDLLRAIPTLQHLTLSHWPSKKELKELLGFIRLHKLRVKLFEFWSKNEAFEIDDEYVSEDEGNEGTVSHLNFFGV